MEIQDFGKWALNEKITSRGTEISEEEFLRLFSENCKNFNPWKNKSHLRRNSNKTQDFIYLDPEGFERKLYKSYYGNLPWGNWLFDESDHYKQYPRRRNSVIGSLWTNWARTYGNNHHYIIPYDTAKIAVFMKNDFLYVEWDKKLKSGNIGLRMLLKSTIIPDIKNSYPTQEELISKLKETYEDLNGLLEEKENKLSEYKSTGREFSWYQEAIEELKILKNENLIEWEEIIPWMLNEVKPENEKIKIFNFTTAEFYNFKRVPDKIEAWTNGPCLLVESRRYNSLKDKLKEINGVR